MKPELSVIVPFFNAAMTIGAQLEALSNQEWDKPWEILVADNGSTDASVEIIKTYQDRLPNLRLIDASARRGASYARNMAVQAAEGQLLAFCDADDEVAPGWVAAMGEALYKHDFVASCAELEKLNPPWLMRGKKSQHDGVVIFLDYLPAASTWGLGIRRTIHEAVGGFDESMLRLQDIDYCWRVQLRGVTLDSTPEAVVHYRYSSNLATNYHKYRLGGQYHILLNKRYGSLGMPKLTLKADLIKLRRLIRQLPQIRDIGTRFAWVCEYGRRLGRLQGRVKYRVLLL